MTLPSSHRALLIALLACYQPLTAAEPSPVYRDPAQSQTERMHDLIARMTLEEKAGMMSNGTPGVPRLGVPKFDWWSEALHGVANAGTPQAGTIFHGLTFWSPNINIFRDPRWGRGKETYGEDPFLTARLGVAFVRGLQGDTPEHPLAAACAKHFAVHSGPESLRHNFDVSPPEADLYDTYQPAFEAFVREAHVEAVMTAYNSLNGTPCSMNPLLYALLAKWGFDGHVTSDCGSVDDLSRTYGRGGPAEVNALTLRAAREAMVLLKNDGLLPLNAGKLHPVAVVHLAHGEVKIVAITVPATALRRWSEAQQDYAVPAGEWTIRAGASSADIRQSAAVKL